MSEPRPQRKSYMKKKVCRFCTAECRVDYKNPRILSLFVNERGKIIPRRITGTCSFHQRDLTTAVKRARCIALLPFTATHANLV